MFTYNYSSTAIVSSISPLKLSVLGGETITIIGTNLPNNPQNIQIGKRIVNFVSSNSTQLVIQSPALAPGLYDLKIPVASLGLAL